MRRRAIFVVLILLLSSNSFGVVLASAEELSEGHFEPLMTADSNTGIVVGVACEGGEEIFSVGNEKLDGDTLFEIGSVTKVFTTLALAVMCKEGKLKLSDKIKDYVPDEVNVPSKNGKQIQLLHLATHTSGLDRLPVNFLRPGLFAHMDNPYKGYTVDMLYEGLSASKLMSEPGEYSRYSNFGVGLLGQLLVNASGKDYEALVQEKICRPLGMQDTMVELTDETKSKLAKGYLKTGGKASNWDMGALVGAGGLKSNIKDMMTFLKEHISPENEKLKGAINLTMEKRFDEREDSSIGLGWFLKDCGDYQICWHNGGTGGYSSFIGMVRDSKLGIVILGNANFYNELTLAGFDYLGELQKRVNKTKAK